MKNKSFNDISSISESNHSYVIDFTDYQITVSNIENVIDRDAQGRIFSNLVNEHSSNTAPYFHNDGGATEDYRVFPSEHMVLEEVQSGIIVAEDAENDDLDYSISGGVHQDYFGILNP